MFLIQYAKGMFVNADRIEIVTYTGGLVKFYATSDSDNAFHVEDEFAAKFINNLQVLSGNISNIEADYLAISKGENK